MKIAHNKPTIQTIDEEAVLSVLKSGYIAQGHAVEKFESLISERTELKHSVVVSNGTTALFLSLWAMGINRGDDVILPTYVCSALLNSIYMLGAKPVLVDVDTTDFNIQWSKVGNYVNSKSKAFIVPHIHGMPTIIPQEYIGSFKIIEDCCTAVNSYVNGVHVGHQADCAAFSFYATKYLSAAGTGGCVSTSNEELANKMLDYREFDCREEYYPRFNFQITDVQAAMGISQIKRVDEFTKRRNVIADTYKSFFDSVGVDYQKPLCGGIISNNYRFIIKLQHAHRDKLMKLLHSKGVSCIIPINQDELLHNYLKMDRLKFPNAEEIAATTLSLPIYPLLSDDELSYILQILKSYLL